MVYVQSACLHNALYILYLSHNHREQILKAHEAVYSSFSMTFINPYFKFLQSNKPTNCEALRQPGCRVFDKNTRVNLV